MRWNQHGNGPWQRSPIPTRIILYLPWTYTLTCDVEMWVCVCVAGPRERPGLWVTLWEGTGAPGVGNWVFQGNMAPFNAVEEVISPRHTSSCPGRILSTWGAVGPTIQCSCDRWLVLEEGQSQVHKSQNVSPINCSVWLTVKWPDMWTGSSGGALKEELWDGLVFQARRFQAGPMLCWNTPWCDNTNGTIYEHLPPQRACPLKISPRRPWDHTNRITLGKILIP